MYNRNNNAQLSHPETRSSFLFARGRPTQSRCGAARAGTVVWPDVAAAALLLHKPIYWLLVKIY